MIIPTWTVVVAEDVTGVADGDLPFVPHHFITGVTPDGAVVDRMAIRYQRFYSPFKAWKYRTEQRQFPARSAHMSLGAAQVVSFDMQTPEGVRR